MQGCSNELKGPATSRALSYSIYYENKRRQRNPERNGHNFRETTSGSWQNNTLDSLAYMNQLNYEDCTWRRFLGANHVLLHSAGRIERGKRLTVDLL
jgi:hypothetical protein